MNIIEALEAVDRGERVRHDSWDGEGYVVSNGKAVVDKDGFVCTFVPSSALRDGWSIVSKTFDFAEAVRRMRGGRCVRRRGWKFGVGIISSERIGDRLTPIDVSATDWEEV
jgi:hypothetical protein